MPNLLAALLVFTTLTAAAQQSTPQLTPPPAGSNWQHVEMLPTGTSIYVYTRGRHKRCEFASADAGTLTCIRGKRVTFQRTEIASIKLAHRGRSSLVGLAVGVGGGIGIGSAIPLAHPGGPLNFEPIARALLVGIGAASGTIGGSLAGYLTDFTRSTVYKAP